MKLTLSSIFFLIVVNALSQDFDLDKVRLFGIENLKAELIDSNLITYASIDSKIGVWYKLRQSEPRFEWVNKLEDLKLPSKKIKVISAKLCGYLRIPYSKCLALDTIFGRFHIIFDNKLNIIEKPKLKFIPETYFTDDSCKILSKSEIKKIVEKEGLKFGTDSLFMNLSFDEKRQTYIWNVSKEKCHEIDKEGRCWGEIEILKIEAETKKIVTHYITSLGHIIDFE